MGLRDIYSLFGLIGGDYSMYMPDDEGIDYSSFEEWLHASEVERARMELTMTEEGRLAFREKARKLGFFNAEGDK